MATLKVGVIGVGGIAVTHMPGWQDSSGLTEVVAGCDLNEVALQQWGEKFGVPRLTTSPVDIINDPDIDIVDICTPNMYHAPLAIAALDAGKHVLVEKPLAPTPQAIRDMIAARDRSGKLLMTAQHFRFQGSAKALKAEIESLGNIYHARAWMLRRAKLPARPGFVLKEHSGGGACIDIGVHILDLTLWFMGHPCPVTVSGVARTELAHQKGAWGVWGDVPDQIDVEEFAGAFVRFGNGATLMLEVSWLLHHDAPTNYEDMQVWLYGIEGGAHWPKCEIYQSNNATRQLYNRSLLVTDNTRPPHAEECIEFAQAILDGGPSPVPAEQSLQVMSILDGIYRSQETGCEVRLEA